MSGMTGSTSMVADLKRLVTTQDERRMYWMVTLGVYAILVLLLRRPWDLPLPDRDRGPRLPRLDGDHRAGLPGPPPRARPLGGARLEGELLPLRDPRRGG